MYLFNNLSVRYHKATVASASSHVIENLNITSNLIQPILGFSSLLILFLFPAITMKLFAEEKRSGSLELLMTSPLKLTEIIVGKFTGALLFLFIPVAFSLLSIVFLFFWSTPEIGVTLTGIFGIFLFASSIVSIGIFASTLTDSQMIAFIAGFGCSLFFYIMNWISFNTFSEMSQVAGYLSILPHLIPFLKGIFSTADLFYYLSFTGLFLFLSYRKLEMIKWR